MAEPLAAERRAGVGRILLGLLWVSVCLGGVAAAGLWPDALAEGFGRLSSTLRDAGPSGMAAVLAVAVLIAASGVLPASLLGIASGALYGTALGFGFAALGVLAGAALSFWLSRSMLRPVIAGYIGRRTRWVSFDALVSRDGWRLVGLLRISPVMPFALTSFALGLSSIGTGPYIGGTLAALPALFGFVALGAAAGGLGVSGLGGFGPLRLGLLVVGGVATILVSTLFGRHLAASARDRTPAAGPTP